jgi:hypothetical protein
LLLAACPCFRPRPFARLPPRGSSCSRQPRLRSLRPAAACWQLSRSLPDAYRALALRYRHGNGQLGRRGGTAARPWLVLHAVLDRCVLQLPAGNFPGAGRNFSPSRCRRRHRNSQPWSHWKRGPVLGPVSSGSSLFLEHGFDSVVFDWCVLTLAFCYLSGDFLVTSRTYVCSLAAGASDSGATGNQGALRVQGTYRGRICRRCNCLIHGL